MSVKLILDILEIFYNETDDLGIIADRCNCDILTVAFIVGDNV